jgi:predicted RNase H-like nuclease (RuvC/YqgF family)
VEMHRSAPHRLIPAALREVAGDAAAELDYEVLAGVLLQTTLRALRGGDAESGTGEPEPVESLRAEMAANRSRIMDLEAQVRILEHNNRTLTEALARRQASPAEALSPTQRDLAHLMAQKPTARG